MAEPLKEMFNKVYYQRLADSVQEAYARFEHGAFLRDVTKDLASRELNARLRHTSVTLHRYLPARYQEAVHLLREVALTMPKGYTALVFPDFVGLYGLDDKRFSLDALRYFTAFGSSEFAVREYFKRDVNGTLACMKKWAEDPSEHVRRLASEGSRPRLPWSFRLDAVVKDPSLTQPILHQLRADASLYVRKSVANHLNDVSKDHPERMVDVVRGWALDHPYTAWIAKHACRTLIKKGDARALALFAFEKNTRVQVSGMRVIPAKLRLGDVLEFSFTLRSEAAREQKLVVDYRIHYRKADGKTSAKVFKLKELVLPPRAAVLMSKRQRIQDLSTRKHYTGKHRVEILVNGKVGATATFDLKA
jgi:3-methyladenine DNA glycosylase AlkC